MSKVEELPKNFDTILLSKTTVADDIEIRDMRDKIRNNIYRGNRLTAHMEDIHEVLNSIQSSYLERDVVDTFVNEWYKYEKAANLYIGRCCGDKRASSEFDTLKRNEMDAKNQFRLKYFEKTDSGYTLRKHAMEEVSESVEDYNRICKRVLVSDIDFSYIANDGDKTVCFTAPCDSMDVANELLDKRLMKADACSIVKDGKQVKMCVDGLEVETEEKPKTNSRSLLAESEMQIDKPIEGEQKGFGD